MARDSRLQDWSVHNQRQHCRRLHNSVLLTAACFPLGPPEIRIFGFAERDVVGQFLPIVPEALYEEHRKLLKTSLDGSVTTAFETIRQRSDGSQIPVNASRFTRTFRFFSCLAMPKDFRKPSCRRALCFSKNRFLFLPPGIAPRSSISKRKQLLMRPGGPAQDFARRRIDLSPAPVK